MNGKMTGGFAILATPVKYGETGIMSFIIGRQGFVYERDLGPDTAKTAASIQQYNPWRQLVSHRLDFCPAGQEAGNAIFHAFPVLHFHWAQPELVAARNA